MTQIAKNLRTLRLQKSLTQELDCRGLVIDREYPAKLAAECKKKKA